MRELLKDGPIQVWCVDDPDHDYGGACHAYEVASGEEVLLEVKFQHGPVCEVGANGVQHSHLLAIVADRLRSFQLGAYASALNEIALNGVASAMAADTERTARRSLAGVEGFNKPAPGVEVDAEAGT